MYAAVPEERFPIPAADLADIEPQFYRRIVKDPTGERPGTLVVKTQERMLYLVRDDGKAVRYGVGIGRAGFAWSGRAMIAAKRQWPTWTPPAEMIARQPELEQWRQGMPPGLANPLGARALYIHKDGVDTLYRLHGTVEDWSIGRAVSSGCVRLINQDAIDLYQRVPVNTPILVA
jgi:lipoprotein-anchoring transpeptidase ErfK/SrfK